MAAEDNEKMGDPHHYDNDSSDSDDEKERGRKHKFSRAGRISQPWFVPTYFHVKSGELMDGTQLSDSNDITVEHVYRLNWYQKIFVTLEYPTSSKLGFLIGVVTQMVIVLNVITGIIASSPEVLKQPSSCTGSSVVCHNDAELCPDKLVCLPEAASVVDSIDIACFIIFAIDYLLRLLTSLFTPPRVGLLLSDDWDIGERELQRQTKRSHNIEIAKDLKSRIPPIPVTEENVRPLIFAKLLEMNHFKNFKDMYCCCGLYKKLTAIIMVSMNIGWDTTIHELGTRHLLEFHDRLERLEAEFAQEFRRGRSCFTDNTAIDNEEGEASSASICLPCANRGSSRHVSKRYPHAGATDDSCGDASPGIESSDSSFRNIPELEFDTDVRTSTWSDGLSKMEREKPLESCLRCTPIRNRLDLTEAWMLEIDSHFTKICYELGKNPDELAPRCSYDDERARSDPDWPIYERAARFIFSFQNMVDFASICPLFVLLVTIRGGGAPVDAVSTTFLRVVRCFRLLRVIKLNPYSAATLYLLRKTMENSAETLLYLMLMTIIIAVLFAFIMFQLECGTFMVTADYPMGAFMRIDLKNEYLELSPFRSVAISLYYTCVTMTTLGYGDMYPTSNSGRALASLIAFTGILSIALPTSVISTNFSQEYAKYKKTREEMMRERRHISMNAAQKDKARRRQAEQKHKLYEFEGLGLIRRAVHGMIKDTSVGKAASSMLRRSETFSNSFKASKLEVHSESVKASGSAKRNSVFKELRINRKSVKSTGQELLTSSDQVELTHDWDEPEEEDSPLRTAPLASAWRIGTIRRIPEVEQDDSSSTPLSHHADEDSSVHLSYSRGNRALTISSLDVPRRLQSESSPPKIELPNPRSQAAPMEAMDESSTQNLDSTKTSHPSSPMGSRKQIQPELEAPSLNLSSAKVLQEVAQSIANAQKENREIYEASQTALSAALVKISFMIDSGELMRE